MKTRNRRGEGNRLRGDLIDAVTTLLARSGDTSRVTIRAVAAEAGVSPAAVYLHFADRTELLRTTIDRRFAELGARLDEAAAGGRAGDRVVAAALAYLDFAHHEPGAYRALFSTVDAGPNGLGLAEGAAHPGAPVLARLVGLVEAALAERGDTRDAWTVSVQLWAILHGLADLRITKPEIPWPDAAPIVVDVIERLDFHVDRP